MTSINQLLKDIPYNERGQFIRDGTTHARALFPDVDTKLKSGIIPQAGDVAMIELAVQLGAFLAQFSEDEIRRYCRSRGMQ